MEKYHTIVKIERIRKELQQGNFALAYELACTINVNKIKVMGDLGLIAEAYFHGKQYRQAKEYYVKVYKATNSRRVLSQLVHVSIKLREIETANRYLKEFEEVAPDDFYRYIYRYQLGRMEGKSLEECIQVLEALKKEEYIDHWAYELAKLYHKAGEEEKCQEECDRIILWFGEGDYVNRAKALKAYYRGELDVTLAGNDAERFSKEIQRVLKREEELRSAGAMQKEELQEELPKEALSEEDSLFSDISKGLADAVFGMEVADQKAPDVPEEHDMDGEGEGPKQISESEVSDEAFEQTIYKLLEEENVSLPLVHEFEPVPDENMAVREEEEAQEPLEEEPDVQEEGILVYPAVSDDVSWLPADSRLSALMEEREISLSGIFGNFMQIGQVCSQTVKSLEQICNGKGGNVCIIVTGEPGPGSAEMLYAKSMAKMLYRTQVIKSNKIAMIEGNKVNQLDLASKAHQLKDCCLIIEDAGRMGKQAMDSLVSLCKKQEGSIAVILEDSRTHINRLLRGKPELSKLFATRIHLPKYGNADWKGFVYDYLKGKDYEISLKADRLLTERIDELLKTRKENIWDVISAFMQEVIDRADKRNGELLYKLSTAGKLDGTELMVIQESDFLDFKP